MIFTIKIPLYLEMLQIKNCTNWHCSFQEVTVKKNSLWTNGKRSQKSHCYEFLLTKQLFYSFHQKLH